MNKALSGPWETSVQKKNGTLSIRSLLGELNAWVSGVDVLPELVAVFCLLDDKGVIYISK